METVRIYPISEQAITVSFGDKIDRSTHDRVMALQQAVEKDPFPGYREGVPAYSTLTVYYDPLSVICTDRFSTESNFEQIARWLTEKISPAGQTMQEEEQTIRVPVCYHPSLAADLNAVSDYLRISIPEIIRLHTQSAYRVFMTGFVPGFPYLGILPEALEMPRKQRPVTAVPAGSVAIAGRQTGIYPLSVPGGWQVIGRTPLRIFDKDREPCCLLRPGMTVSFYEISPETFQNLSER